MNSQLSVVVRVRPLNEKEKARGHYECVIPLDDKRVLLSDPEKNENNILRQNRIYDRQFTFDAAFGKYATQEDVHSSSTGPIVDYVVAGYNATVFAYGATGSGKTYTMIGTKERPGLMTLLTKSLYEKISLEEYQIQLSYMEIYNEVIRDLLNPASGVLDLMEDERGNIRVPGLSSVKAPNLNRIMQILQEGNQRRTQEATEANKTSSRSHALLQVSVLKNNRIFGKLFLIDLAGSERASHTNNRGQRLKEGAAINRSLLALGNVINSLSSGSRGYVNYRDSKLTRLLKDSLGGNAKTCMIAHVTAASGFYEETYNTLVYASRAKNIVNKPVRNRPASADPPYSEALREMRKDYENRLPHASSSQQLSDKTNSMDRPSPTGNRGGLRWNSNTNAASKPRKVTSNMKANAANGSSRDFSNLFNQLKQDLVTTNERQQRLREQLMEHNRESYEAEMSRASKIAIISAWERQKTPNKSTETIDRLKADIEEMDTRLSNLVEQRRKVEKSLRKGQDLSRSLETRLRGLAQSREQKDMLDLICRMADVQVAKISAQNDLVIQNILMQKTDHSMTKLQRYEMLAEKLIEGQLEGKDREQAEQEYRVAKNQFHYHLIPLKQMPTISWNTQMLPKINTGPAATTDDIPRANSLSKKKRESIQLPLIVNGKEKRRQNSDTSDSMEMSSDRSIDSPNSLKLPAIKK